PSPVEVPGPTEPWSMTKESIFVSAMIPASPDDLYGAWLDSETHAAMTGGRARVDPRIGGRHSAWDEYIEGETIALEPGRRLVQSWRTQEFPPDAESSRVEIRFEPSLEGTRVSIDHS